MNEVVLLIVRVILTLFTLFGAAGFIVGITKIFRKKDDFGEISIGLVGLMIGLGGFFLLTR